MTRAHLVAIALVCLTAAGGEPTSRHRTGERSPLPALGGHCHALADLVVDDCTPVFQCPR